MLLAKIVGTVVATRKDPRLVSNKLLVVRPVDPKGKAAWRSLVAVATVDAGVGEQVLNVSGVGFRAQVTGKNLVLNVGYSHPVEITPREGITFTAVVDPAIRQPVVTVAGIDKEVVGQQAAEVRKVRPPEPYKGKGIKYSDEIIRRKAGKSGKAGGKGGGKGAAKKK